MEVIEEYIVPILRHSLSPSTYLQLTSYAVAANDYFHNLRLTYAEPYIINPIRALINSPPDLYSILILTFMLLISLEILKYARRVIKFWIVLVFRLLFWGAIIGGGWYVYNVGWGKASRDAAWILGLMEGFIRQLLAESGSAGRGGNEYKYKASSWGRRQR
ncbi:hypothetical protein PRK78_007139 [Emydomyces testavorans]|uniref:Nuclear pore assembly and biogenesis-domain-containing protein n=1 Tax=Emydomyces testavorans TaxID=2070801 RepID=A0AAF0ILE5_9EURO|nr:hypothetical protein PRK78_007139 [Emydomyces testavorans]